MTTEDTRTYDVVVIGAGPVGENVADRTTAAVLAHRDRMAAHWNDDGQVEWLKTAGIDLQRGHGRLDGPRRVAVTTPDGGTVHLRARHAVAVCTGSGAALPDLPGLTALRPWTSREAASAPQPPGRLVIVGAGVVATEMATAWQALGTESPSSPAAPACCATFAGSGVAELLHSATVAITGEISIERLWHAVPPFPTISEVWLRLLETYRGQELSAGALKARGVELGRAGGTSL
ncbi:FAD-dependent oxidoreductase [Nonomuraea sp. NPDC005983]|uniref:FAD-dependent oxidoreductase n=1 Tax=Nonomuraea sp. NPDC005983 TaxID=3155595 RepID=UPI0033B0BD15